MHEWDCRNIVELLEALPDHWSVMRVTRFGGGCVWRVYDNCRNLVEDGDDLQQVLKRALGG